MCDSFISKSTQCSSKAIDEEPKCDEKSRIYMKEAIKVFSSEVFDLFCGNDLIWDSHECKKVTKNLPVELKSKKPLSVLPIVMDMMDRFWHHNKQTNQQPNEQTILNISVWNSMRPSDIQKCAATI